MEYRRFGDTSILVHPITFGAWSIGGAAKIGGIQVGWSGVDDKVSMKAIDAAVDSGINLFDTADSYAEGHSEKLLGKALAGKRSGIHISTKVGLVNAVNGVFKLDFSREHIVKSCEESLIRLATDYIDIYMLHMVTDGYPMTEEIKESLELLKKQGKIRYYGVSVQNTVQGKELLDKEFGKAMMIEYNPWSSDETEDVLNQAENQKIGVITRGALAKGLLSGKYKKGHRFTEDDVRSRLAGSYIDKILGDVSLLKQYCEEKGGDLLELALSYPLQNPGCSTVTVGMKTPEQVAEIVKAAEARTEFKMSEIQSFLVESKR